MVGEEEVVHEETVIVGTSSRGNPKTKNKKKTVVNWMSRETKVCVDDAEQLRKDMITSLSGRINEYSSCNGSTFHDPLWQKSVPLVCGAARHRHAQCQSNSRAGWMSHFSTPQSVYVT